jgi:hypothetical protein
MTWFQQTEVLVLQLHINLMSYNLYEISLNIQY